MCVSVCVVCVLFLTSSVMFGRTWWGFARSNVHSPISYAQLCSPQRCADVSSPQIPKWRARKRKRDAERGGNSAENTDSGGGLVGLDDEAFLRRVYKCLLRYFSLVDLGGNQSPIHSLTQTLTRSLTHSHTHTHSLRH